MKSPPEAAASLLELQREFARALQLQPGSAPGVQAFGASPQPAAASRLDVYRNNARQFFRTALELTYPVVRRRVGEDYFRALAEEYRGVHPSRRGDLHWVGAAFPAWLADRLAGTEYGWLGELARLEWLCAESMAAHREPALPLQCLASVPADRLDAVRLRLQPSLRLLSARYPVWSVWQANQGEGDAEPVDLALGPEHCAIACLDERVTVYRLEAAQGRLLDALAGGTALGRAVELAGVDADTLAALLGWAFSEQLVVAVNPSAPA
jgi:hypothetical protein